MSCPSYHNIIRIYILLQYRILHFSDTSRSTDVVTVEMGVTIGYPSL